MTLIGIDLMATRTPARSRRNPPPEGEGAPLPADPLLERIAWLLDNSIQIPGTRYRIGLDPLLGLLPGVGDFLSAAIQSGLVILAIKRYNVPHSVATRMVANVLMDMGFGSVPVVGDLFDATFKASSRNIRLLREVHEQRQRGEQEEEISRSSRRHLILIGTALGVGLTVTLIAAIVFIVWLVRLILGA